MAEQQAQRSKKMKCPMTFSTCVTTNTLNYADCIGADCAAYIRRMKENYTTANCDPEECEIQKKNEDKAGKL